MHRRAFAEEGFTIVPGVLDQAECDRLPTLVRSCGDPGSRGLLGEPWCNALAGRLRRHPELTALVPADHAAVQCIFFEKSVSTNWLVPVHQDLSIPVQSRIDHPGLSGWSVKEGVQYVQPPVGLLEALVAVRVNLDACGAGDGPLRVVPRSHLSGRISAEAAPSVRARYGEVACGYQSGSVMVMRPLLLHGSSKARGTSRRRVLHFLFGPRSLPHGLSWRYTS